MQNLPRIVIAGAHSGSGKTSLTIALVGALRRRGYRVQTFKVGPDFLDPTYLTLASGRPCYNLDSWMMSREHIQHLFTTASGGADIAVIEGVMGLFDGANPTTLEGSTAQIACWLDAPVLLIVNAYGMSRSFAALIKGLVSFEPKLNVIGVIANYCGSQNHAQLLSTSLQAAGLPLLMGAIPQDGFITIPNRHLGLVTANEHNLTKSVMDNLSDAVERHASIDALLQCLNVKKPLSPEKKDKQLETRTPSRDVRIGIAWDEAFHFYYQDLLDVLVKKGCTIIRFSPLADNQLPDNLSGLYIGGGYPEIHARALAENKDMLSSIRAFANSGRLVYAECGGLMYLSRGIETAEGQRYVLLDILPVWTKMSKRQKALGYVEVRLTGNSLWGKKGDIVRGHEFHYSELIENPCSDPLWKPVYELKKPLSDNIRAEGFQKENILASYIHLYYAAKPEAVDYFIKNCIRLNKKTGGNCFENN
jgi:cobyrinic acid a,c-diamide synthase